VFATTLFSTPSPSFSARRAVQEAAATAPPKGRRVFLYSRRLCTQRPPPPRSARLDTTGPAATAPRARRAPSRTLRAQVGAAAPRIMLPVTHVLLLSDASDALGQQYPAPFIRTPPPQRTSQRSVSRARNPNPETPNPKCKPQTLNLNPPTSQPPPQTPNSKRPISNHKFPNPKLHTPYPKPHTPNPRTQPPTPNPQPPTPNPQIPNP